MLDRRPLARGYNGLKTSHIVGLMAGMIGAGGVLPPPRHPAQRPAAPPPRVGTGAAAPGRPRVGAGGGNCDTDWVASLLQGAQDACATPAGPDLISLPASGSVAAGATGSMTVTVQRNGFIGRRLILPDTIAANILIDDVLVGGRSIFTSQYSLSGELFSTKAEVCSWLKWPKVSAGFDIVVEFTNIHASVAQNIRGAAIEGASWG